MPDIYIKNNFSKIKEVLYKYFWVIRYIQMPESIGIIDYRINNLIYHNDSISIYIHVPFCFQKCSYCNYHGDNNIHNFWSEKYVNLLIKELHIFLENNNYKKYNLSSLLIWWWTPTVLKWKDIYKLMKEIKKHFIIDDASELSIETVPNTISAEKSRHIKKSWFNRVSMWVQSFNEDILKKVWRKQKNIVIYKAFENLRNAWVDYISIDLILWLDKNETEEDFITLSNKHLDKLKPQEIYFFTLQDEKVSKKYDREKCLELLYYKWLKYNNSKYVNDRIFLFKNVLWLWYWAQGQILNQNWELSITSNKYKDIELYEKSINKWYKISQINNFTEKQTVTKYIIRWLFSWINKEKLLIIFNDKSLIIFNKIMERISSYIIEDEKSIIIDFDKLGFIKEWENKEDKYFIFCFIYIYENKDRDKLSTFIDKNVN